MASMRALIDLVETSPSDAPAPEGDIKVWHVTRTSALQSILRQGLVPRRGARSRRAQETEKAIYVFTDSIALEDAMTNWLGEEYDDVPISLLELSVPRDWITRLASRWEAAIHRPVPANRIRVLVPDMDDWHGEYPGGQPPPGWMPAE